MDRACIALVDATRARYFTFSRVHDHAGSHEELVERPDLVNGAPRPFSQPDPGFARAVLAGLREVLDAHPARSVMVCTSAGMVHAIRSAASGLLPDDVVLDVVPAELVNMTPADVLTRLASSGALAPHPSR